MVFTWWCWTKFLKGSDLRLLNRKRKSNYCFLNMLKGYITEIWTNFLCLWFSRVKHTAASVCWIAFLCFHTASGSVQNNFASFLGGNSCRNSLIENVWSGLAANSKITFLSISKKIYLLCKIVFYLHKGCATWHTNRWDESFCILNLPSTTRLKWYSAVCTV